MTVITLEEAQKSLPDLLARLQPGEEILISEQGQPLAQVKKVGRKSGPARAGCYQKPEFWMAPDFDAPLEEFREYME
jgi:antitoxin (DNA-binding transcriptional repressor) of toxin-antitoxin stability system